MLLWFTVSSNYDYRKLIVKNHGVLWLRIPFFWKIWSKVWCRKILEFIWTRVKHRNLQNCRIMMRKLLFVVMNMIILPQIINSQSTPNTPPCIPCLPCQAYKNATILLQNQFTKKSNCSFNNLHCEINSTCNPSTCLRYQKLYLGLVNVFQEKGFVSIESSGRCQCVQTVDCNYCDNL